jgi:hypothetical protein
MQAYSDTGLTEGTLYYYRIRPYTSSPAQNGAYSNTTSATTTPAAPSALDCHGGWTKPRLTLLGPITATPRRALKLSARRITQRGPKSLQPGPALPLTTIRGLDPATTYYYRVRAYQGAVNSAYSNTATTTTIFTTPSDLAAVAASPTQINLTWTDTAVGEDGYKVEQSTDDISFSQIATTAASATGYSATGLTEGTLYYFRVRPYVGATNGLYSNEASATTTPAAPSALGCGRAQR